MKVFVPRDAGFFSVFNFLVGAIHNQSAVYPLFNKSLFLKVNDNTNDHFCYWTDSENSWLDFFEPIRYHADDKNHLDIQMLLKQPVSQGHEAPPVFKFPDQTNNLMASDRFLQWRKNIHGTYSKYIKFKPNIVNRIHKYIDTNQEYIGVHYRHPSHFVESGKIFLQQYFDNIDDILSQHPKCKIFVASDCDFGILAMKERYGRGRVAYMEDVTRLSLDNFLHWAFALHDNKPDVFGFMNGVGYELQHITNKNNNNYQMTFDLLTEVYIMSHCKYLVNTQSNIGLAISYMNPSLEIRTIKGI